MSTHTRRGVLAALTATAASAALTPAATSARPVVTPYARLAGRLARIRYHLSVHRVRQDPEVAQLRRAVVSLVAVVEDLVALVDDSRQEPTR